MAGVDELERVLRRKELPRGQVTLLKALYERDGEYISREELADEIRWGDVGSLNSVLAAFAKRINWTEELSGESPGYEAFIERRSIEDETHFRLRPEARRAVERVEPLLDTFEKPMEELLEGITIEPSRLGLAEQMTREARDEPIDAWEPQTPENRILKTYWEKVGGTIIAEVETGSTGPKQWPEGASSRRLDAIRFPNEGRDEIWPPTAFTQHQIQELVSDRHVEVIEVKNSLNRGVIGQAIAGRDLFERDYGPGTTEPVILSRHTDTALEWVCRRNGIKYRQFEPIDGSEE